MLDFSDEIYSWLTYSLREKFPKIYTTKTETAAPPVFPAVSIVQENNVTYQRTRDARLENHVSVMFQMDIYTNDKDNKERQAQEIRDTVSDLMQSIGFNRTMCKPTPNLADMSIYRITMRFTGIIGKDRVVYAG